MSGLPELIEEPPPAYADAWWTWNMTVAWIALRSSRIVDRIGEARDDAFAFGEFLLNSVSGRETELDREMELAQSSGDTNPKFGSSQKCASEDPSLAPEEAERELLRVVRAGKIEITAWTWPDTYAAASKRINVPIREFPYLQFGAFIDSDEGVLAYGSRVNEPGARTRANCRCYRSPRLRRANIIDCFPPIGVRRGSRRQVSAATRHLAEFLREAGGTPRKADCLRMLREAQYEFTDNQYREIIWPDAVESAGRTELRRPGRRR